MAYDMSEYNEISSVKTSNNEVFNFADTSLRETVSQLSSNSSTITIDGDISDLSIANVTIGEYKQILSTRTILSNELFVVRNEGYVDAYGEQIKHVAPGIELSDAVNVEQLSATATDLKTEIKDYVDNEIQEIQIPNDLSDLENSKHFVISSEISARLAEEYSKVFIDNRLSSVSKQTDLSIIVLSSSEYNQLVTNDSTLSDALYIVENDNEDMYNQRIINLAPGIDLSDAVNVEQLSNLSLSLDNKIIIDDRISGIVDKSDLSVIKLLASEYEQLVYDDGTLSNALYIVEKDYLDQYGQQIKNLGAPTDLSDAATKEYVDNLISLQDFSKVFIDNRISSVYKQTDLSVIKLSSTEYEQLVYNDQTLSDALYIVENQYDNLYGQQIRNVGEPTLSSDAATKNYVDTSLQNVQIPTDLSAFTNSPGYFISNDISDYYYIKSETSSAVEIQSALDEKQPSGNYALTSQIPTKTSQLTNNSGFLTAVPDTYALKTDIPNCVFETVTVANNTITLESFKTLQYTAQANGSLLVLASSGTSTAVRDTVLVLDLTNATAFTLTWEASKFHPRIAAARDLACDVGKINVYYINEFKQNHYVVARWVETTAATSGAS